MTNEAFDNWVRLHCKHTASDGVTAGALKANREIIVTKWAATYQELCECSERLIANGRTPKFANEHLDAIHAELRAYRAERARHESTERNVVPMGERLRGCDCPDCNGGEVLPSYQRATDKLREYLKEHKELAGGIFKSIPGRK